MDSEFRRIAEGGFHPPQTSVSSRVTDIHHGLSGGTLREEHARIRSKDLADPCVF
jgi:hypothetical protein